MKPLWLLLTLCLAAGSALAKHETLSDAPELTLEAVQNGEAELLDPEVAFALHSRIENGDTIVAEFFIAPGYYAYRDKFQFSTTSPGIVLADAQFPAGKIKDDEFFGRMEIYREQASIRIPFTSNGDTANIELVVRSQGCADIGVCYPPQTETVALEVPRQAGGIGSQAAAPAEGAMSSFDPVSRLTQALGLDTAEEELLDPEKAYILRIEQAAEGLRARWEIADGYYLYKDKMKFELAAENSASLGAPTLSEAKHKTDPFFGEIQAYYHNATAELPISGPAGEGLLTVGYQGCNEVIGVCYPPISKEIEVRWAVQPATAGVMAVPAIAGSAAGAAPVAEQDQIAAMLGSASTWLILLSFFGFGLLLTFTPCVLPMIPILSSIIVGQGESVTTRKAFILSLVYVLAMASTYAVAGVLVGLSGENVQAWFQNPWVLGAFAALFVGLSLSMFGFYELQVPGFVQDRLSALSNRQQGGTLTGVAIMGFLSALIVGPCVTAPLVGALIYIAQTGDAVIGGAALLALGLGMGVPLLLVGTSAGRLLPRAGAWMDSVKAVFGVLILGLAIWMLERVLPLAITMALWAVLLIASAIYMGALEPLRDGASGWRRLWKAGGLVMLLYGGLMLIGAAAGGTSLLYPLKGLVGVPGAGGNSAQAHALEFEMIKGPEGLDQVLAQARAQNRPVMLDFYADWCISCKEMEAFTFTDTGVQAALAGAILVQADVTDNDERDKALLKQFQLFGPPAILFFGQDGIERRNFRVVGFMAAEEFRRKVEQAFAS